MDELKHIAQKILHGGDARLRVSHGVVHVQRDWLITLAVFLCTALLLVFVSSWMFVGVSRGVASFEQGSVPPQTIDREALNAALEQLKTKEHALEELRGTKPSIGNP